MKEEINRLIDQARQERDKQNILEALSLLEKSIHMDIENPLPYGEYGVVLAMQKFNDEKAIYNGHLAVIKDSHNAIHWKNLAYIYYLLGRYNLALISILVSESIDPHLGNIEKLKSLIKGILSKDHMKEMEQIESKTREVFFRYKYKDVIMPEIFFEEILNS